MSEPIRCHWARKDDLDAEYHDQEWGVPSRDDHHLFEMLILEGAQAGLSWNTILRRRPGYRRAYDGFRVEKVARYNSRSESRLLQDEGIIRNRLKVSASIVNARAFMEVQAEFGCFADFLWSFVEGAPRDERRRSPKDVPAETEESKALSRALKKRGFKFVGPTICYAYMQSVGLVNDHELDCFRHSQVSSPS